jgi:NADH dehydrogenase
MNQIPSEFVLAFLGMVFIAVFLLSQGLTVPVFGAIRFSGFFAWLFWLFAHIYFLIGFRNRLMVMIDWAWAYWTYERNARVVAEPASQASASSPTVPRM